MTYQSDSYNPHALEPAWQQRWRDSGLYHVDLHSDKPPYYFLTMFPYPSGDLHVGHWYAETPADAAARYKRMCGYNVLFPMGFDAFGLPAEGAAIKAAQRGEQVHPASLTYQRIETMRAQFEQMGAMFDWSKQVITCDAEYYRWNQWFFLQMYKRGLVYRHESMVNWDPVDQTVLANEQVIDGRGERSGALVEKRLMPQWHVKITDYADELLSFEGLDWPDKIMTQQRNWIGRSEGAEVIFKSEHGDPIPVFTTRPDTLWGATFMVLAPEHPLVDKLVSPERREAVMHYAKQASQMSDIDRQAEGTEKTGEFIGAYAINPVNDAKLPIWIADYVMMGYGTGAIMAVPFGDARDFAFAKAFDLPIIATLQPDDASIDTDPATMQQAYTGTGTVINSGAIDGTHHNGEKGRNSPAIAAAIDYLESSGRGKASVSYRLRDWLISRQRYWGTPIPMIYCDDCGIVPENEANLPIVLPKDVDFMPSGQSPLQAHEDFLHTTCPACGGAARRETDTMDTFVDSSWYWARYLSPHKDDAPVDAQTLSTWAPVDTYTGGIEHAILHLLYARFFTKLMRDIGLIDFGEPFLRLRNQGIILGPDDEKMSKSRGNVVNPDDVVGEYGADAVRAYLMFIGPWEQGGPWNINGIEGVVRFLKRVWSIVVDAPTRDKGDIDTVQRASHLAVKAVTEDFENFQFNTAVAELMTLSNVLAKHKSAEVVASEVWLEAVRHLLLLLAPIAPHIAEELWHRSGNNTSIHLQAWPRFDASVLVEDSVTMAVQVNGKVRAQITVSNDASKDAILETAKAEPSIMKYLAEGELTREIVVPGKLVNLVVR